MYWWRITSQSKLKKVANCKITVMWSYSHQMLLMIHDVINWSRKFITTTASVQWLLDIPNIYIYIWLLLYLLQSNSVQCPRSCVCTQQTHYRHTKHWPFRRSNVSPNPFPSLNTLVKSTNQTQMCFDHAYIEVTLLLGKIWPYTYTST